MSKSVTLIIGEERPSVRKELGFLAHSLPHWRIIIANTPDELLANWELLRDADILAVPQEFGETTAAAIKAAMEEGKHPFRGRTVSYHHQTSATEIWKLIAVVARG